jgi:hypothetical protein
VDSQIPHFSEQTLSAEICQQIYYGAIRNAMQSGLGKTYPHANSWDHMMSAVRTLGPSVLIMHPAEIASIFEGVGISIFLLIESLFCSRADRTISMVTQIVNQHQKSMNLPTISELAVWAICLYLLPKHNETIGVSKEYQSKWLVEVLDWQIYVTSSTMELYQPSAVAVVDIDKNRVISLVICRSKEISNAIALAVLNAVISQRSPSKDGFAGLVWCLPQKVISNIDLDLKVNRFFKDVDIDFVRAEEHSSIVSEIQGVWEKDLRNREITEIKFSLILDNFLYRKFGYSPLIQQRDLKRDYVRRIGYSRDPLWQFPQLRMLLERKPVQVGGDATVRFGVRQYRNELLAYWANKNVEILVSPPQPRFAWVYDLGGEVICQASAR